MLLQNVLLCALLGFLTSYHLCSGQSNDYKIVGGYEVTERSQFPFQASLRREATGRHFCGATIIGERTLLTAAHCLAANTTLPSNIYVVVGDLDTSSQTNETEIHYVQNFTYHERYNRSYIDNDVAVIIIRDRFRWSPRVNYLPLANVRPSAGTNCTISGWGTLSYQGATTTRLRFAVLPIISNAVCATNYTTALLSPGMVCAGYMRGGVDSCQGDSGGPLACGGSLAGVVSWGYACASAGYPGVYADVAYYRTWIQNTLDNYLQSGSNLSHANAMLIFSFIFLSFGLAKN